MRFRDPCPLLCRRASRKGFALHSCLQSLTLPSRIVQRFCVALLLTVLTLPSHIVQRFCVALLPTVLYFVVAQRSALHSCLQSLLCRRTSRPGSCFCMCCYCFAIADDAQVFAHCIYVWGILVEDARDIYHSPSCNKSSVGSERYILI